MMRIGVPLSHGNLWAGSDCSQQFLQSGLGGGAETRPSSAGPVTAGVNVRQTGLRPHAFAGAAVALRPDGPPGSTAIMALTFPPAACGIIPLSGPAIECVTMTAGPIRSSNFATAFVVSVNA